MPKQAKSIQFLAEHEAAHIRIPDKIIQSDEAREIFKIQIGTNSNDNFIYEFYADAVAIYRTSSNINDRNIIKAIQFLKSNGVDA